MCKNSVDNIRALIRLIIVVKEMMLFIWIYQNTSIEFIEFL